MKGAKHRTGWNVLISSGPGASSNSDNIMPPHPTLHPRGVCSTQILLGLQNVTKVYFLSSEVLKIGSCIGEIPHNLYICIKECAHQIRRNSGFADTGSRDQFY
jgi:hypothetical protein